MGSLAKRETTAMKLSELIQHVGDDNVHIQSLAGSITSGTKNKTEAKITFATDLTRGGGGAMHHAATGIKPEWIGLIVWLPKSKMPKELQ